MLPLATRILCAAFATALLAATPALADPGTTGGLPAVEPPVLSPQGGVDGSRSTGQAIAAQAGADTPGADEPASTTPTTTTPETPSEDGRSTVEVPVTEPSSSQPSASATPVSSGGGGGGLPRTGFALAALVAVGTGFLLTGYALRYSRALDG
jgi:hypothetical protein